MDYYSDYTYNATSDSDAVAGIIFGGVFLIFILIITLFLYAIHAFLLSRIFKKAGVEQWIAWVPVYNSWKMLEIGGQPGWWAVLAFVPFVNIASIVFMFIAMYHIGLKLQKEGWFVLLAIFVPIVWEIWLAFDDSKWSETPGAAAVPAAATAPTSETTDDATPNDTEKK